MSERLATITKELSSQLEMLARQKWQTIEEALTHTKKGQKVTMALEAVFKDQGAEGIDVTTGGKLTLPKVGGGHIHLALEGGHLCLQAELPLEEQKKGRKAEGRKNPRGAGSSADGAGKPSSSGRKTSRRGKSSSRAKRGRAKPEQPNTGLAF